MGAWGLGPFDNDTAADMVAKLVTRLLLQVGQARTKRERSAAEERYAEARVAAQLLLLSAGTDILGGPPLDLALTALQAIRANEDWLADWKSPRKMAAQIDSEIRAAKRKMAKVEKAGPLLDRLTRTKRKRRRR